MNRYVTPLYLYRLIYLCYVPCWPGNKSKVVEPMETVQYKNVHRYGETSIKHVDYRRNLPKRQPEREPVIVSDRSDLTSVSQPRRRRPPSYHAPQNYPESSTSSMDQAPRYQAPAPPRQEAQRPPRQEAPMRPRAGRSLTSTKTVTSDFYISVPIFNETLDHSFRKKNVYVYQDNTGDEDSLYHQSISRQSSLRGDAHRPPTASRRPKSGTSQQDRQYRSKSLNRLPGSERRRQRSRPQSEASYDTHSTGTSYSYELETFKRPVMMHDAGSSVGLNVESDDDDLR